MNSESKPIIKINNWAIISFIVDVYQSPEQAVLRLTGNVTDHPKLGKTVVTTSTILNIDLKNKRVETLYSIYELEEPKPEWLDWLKEQGKTLEDYIK